MLHLSHVSVRKHTCLVDKTLFTCGWLIRRRPALPISNVQKRFAFPIRLVNHTVASCFSGVYGVFGRDRALLVA
jgi:hypothetical protein